MFDVVSIAPTGFAVTPRPTTTPVPQGDRPADRGREGPGRRPHVQHLRRTTQHRGDDPGVAGQHPGLSGADRATVFQGGRTDPVPQVLQVDGDGDVRAFPALHGGITQVQIPPEHLLEGLAAAVLGSGVPSAAGRGAARPSMAWVSSSTPRSSNFPFNEVNPVLAFRAPMVNSTFSAGCCSSSLPSGSQVRATIRAN